MLRLLFLLLLSANLYGQRDTTDRVRRLEVGVGYGQMEHTVDFTPSVNDENVRGGSYGITFRYFDHPLVGLQAELAYVEAGWSEAIDGFEEPYVRRTNYAEFLMLTQFSVGRGAVQPLLQAGPYLSFPLSERETLPTGFESEPEDPPSYYGREFPFRLNYGVQAGLGLNLQLGRVTVQAEGRYLVGFNDLVKTGATQAAISRRAGYGGHVAVFYAWRQ